MKELQRISRTRNHGKSYSHTKAFAYISKVSNEKKVQTKEIIKEIKNIKNKNLYLDYGAGVGDISFNISKKFKESIFIEPGKKMFPFLRKKKKEKKSNAKLFNLTGEEFFKKYDKKYIGKIDLITLVHVTYFFKNPKKEIENLLKYLSPNGKLIIIVGYSKNPTKGIIYQFRTKYCGSELYDPKKHMRISDLFPGSRSKIINTVAKLTNIDYLLKHPKKARNSPTNYYLKFLVKRWIDEFNEEELKFFKLYLKKNPLINGKHILSGKNKMTIINKELR